MPRYLFEESHTAEGAKGLLKDGGSGRRAAVEQLVKGLGDKVEALYLALGDVDADVPDAVSADRKSTRLNSSHSSISYAVFCLKKKKKTLNLGAYAEGHEFNLTGFE